MSEALATVGRKSLAVLILVGVSYLMFKVVLGFIMGAVWIGVAVVAVAGVIWALRAL